jgi:hypothetical protein
LTKLTATPLAQSEIDMPFLDLMIPQLFWPLPFAVWRFRGLDTKRFRYCFLPPSLLFALFALFVSFAPRS